MKIKRVVPVALALAVLFGAGMAAPVASAATKEEAKAAIEKYADEFPALYDIAESLIEDMTSEQLDIIIKVVNEYDEAIKEAGVNSIVELPQEKRNEINAELPRVLSELGLRGEVEKDDNGVTILKIYKGDDLVAAVDGNLQLREVIMVADETTGVPMKQTGTAMPLAMVMSGLVALGGVALASKKK